MFMSPHLPARAARLRAALRPDGPLGLAMAAALALAIACWIYTLPFLRGLTPFWQQQDTDITQYVAGFNAFVHEPWHWPLLHIASLNAPDGTLATFVDAIPLYALLLKLWHHGPSVPFWNPYPGWIVLCYLLQGTAAWWLCREAQLRSWPALLALTVLLTTFPALSFRIHHTSLMSQWLLLFALAVYLRSTRLGRLAGGAWCALLLLAFYINLYLFCMSALLFGADWLRHLRRDRRGVLAAPLALGGLLLLSLFFTTLPLAPQSGGGEWGFGFYSMNLLSPFSGGRLLQFPHPEANDGQGEGYAYLGLFMLLATVHALRLRARHDAGFWQRHRSLLVTLALLAAYALSNSVYLGGQELFHVDLPTWTAKFTSQMRVSGRFFWPVGYALMVFTVFTIARHGGRRRNALLAALVALQLWDLHPHHQRVRAGITLPPPHRIETAAWDGFFGADTHALQAYPAFGCGHVSGGGGLLPTMLYAVQRQMTLSTGYIARVKKPCDGMAAQIAAAPASGTGWVFFKTDFASLPAVQQLLGGTAAASCIEVDFAWLCRRARPQATENKQ